MPALAAREGAIGPDIFLFAWNTNQALATFGVVAAGFAILFWSADFLARADREARIIGGAGIVAGAGPMALLAAGTTDMHVAGALLAYASHSAWAAAVGVHLMRSKAGALP